MFCLCHDNIGFFSTFQTTFRDCSTEKLYTLYNRRRCLLKPKPQPFEVLAGSVCVFLTEHCQIVEQGLGLTEHVQLAGVLPGVRLLDVPHLQAVVLSQPHLPILPHQQLPDREDPVSLPATFTQLSSSVTSEMITNKTQYNSK